MIETYDEQNRLVRMPTFYEGSGSYISHTISYLCARNILKNSSPEIPMGLELIVRDKTYDECKRRY